MPTTLSDLSAIVGAFVGEFGRGEHVLGVHHQQQVVVGLQMDIPGAGRGGDVIYGFRIARIADVDDAETLGEHMANIGMAVCHHDLHAVGPSALIGMPDQAHVARVIGFWQISVHR